VGRLASRDLDICLDLNGVKRHVAIIAATGSGKTWFSVVLIEELLKKGAKIVVIDPHGEYVPIRDSIYKLGPYTAKVVKVSRHHTGDLMYKIGVLDGEPDALANAAGGPPRREEDPLRHIPRLVLRQEGEEVHRQAPGAFLPQVGAPHRPPGRGSLEQAIPAVQNRGGLPHGGLEATG